MFQKFQVRGVLPFEAFPILSICCTIQGLNTPKHPYMHPNPINIHTLHPYAHNALLQVSRDNLGQQQTPTDTKRHQQTVPSTPKGCSRMRGGSCWHWMAFAGVFWCLTASFSVLWCLEMWGGCLASFWKGIWVLVMDVFKVWVPPREHLSVQALFGAACFILENLRKAKFQTPSIFETSKYQNLPI